MKISRFLIAILCFTLLILCVNAQYKGKDEVYHNELIRLHIVANSDSELDQTLKLAVRDAILPNLNKLLSDCNNVDEALEVVRANSASIQKEATDVLLSLGCSDDVKIELGKAHYDQRTYKGIVFEEGEYLSLQVVIGKAKGHNWWCVLYPDIMGTGVEYGTSSDGGFKIFGCSVKLKFLDYFK